MFLVRPSRFLALVGLLLTPIYRHGQSFADARISEKLSEGSAKEPP